MASPATYRGSALCTPTTPAFIVDAPLSSMITVEDFMALLLRLSRRGGAPGAGSRVPCIMELDQLRKAGCKGRTAAPSLLDGGGHQGHETPDRLVHSFGHLPLSTAWTPTSPNLNIADLLLAVDPGPRRSHLCRARRILSIHSKILGFGRVGRSHFSGQAGRRYIQHGDTRDPIDYRQPSNLKHTRNSGLDTRRIASKNGVYCSTRVNKQVIQCPWSPSIVTSPGFLSLLNSYRPTFGPTCCPLGRSTSSKLFVAGERITPPQSSLADHATS